jgi:hypothetical protein
VEKQKEERKELIEAVKKLWRKISGQQSVTDGYELPLEKYLHSIRKILAYKNQREKAVDTAKKREDASRRVEELRQRQTAYENKQTGEREKQSADRDRRAAEINGRSVANISMDGKRMYRAAGTAYTHVMESFKRSAV